MLAVSNYILINFSVDQPYNGRKTNKFIEEIYAVNQAFVKSIRYCIVTVAEWIVQAIFSQFRVQSNPKFKQKFCNCHKRGHNPAINIHSIC